MTAPDPLDAACDFPWSRGTFARLHRCIITVDQGLAHASDLQARSLEDAIARSTDPVSEGELTYELEQLRDQDSPANGRVVWGGLVVSIYAAFEHGLEQIFDHWRNETGGPQFRAKGAEDLLAAAARHSVEAIGVPLFGSEPDRQPLDQLRELRRSFVHKGGRIAKFPPATWSAIQGIKNVGFPLAVIEERWCADAFAARYYLKAADRVLTSYSQRVFDMILDRARQPKP